MRRKVVTVYWLIPERSALELFRDLIRILAKEFKAPVFQPHLTLGIARDQRSSGLLLRCVKAAPVRLRLSSVGHSSRFTKTLFVRCKPNGALKALVYDIASDSSWLGDPHISLLYKNLPSAVRNELASVIKLPFREVTLNSLKVVRCISPTMSAADVRRWRVIATKPLSGQR